MSDNGFSLDDILKEHPNKDEKKSGSRDGFDLNSLLSQKSAPAAEKNIKPQLKNMRTPTPVSPIASELQELHEEQEPDIPVKKKLPRPAQEDGSVNLVLAEKNPRRDKFTATIELDFDEGANESNAFEAVENFTDSRSQKPKLKKKKEKRKIRKERHRRSYEDDAPEENPSLLHMEASEDEIPPLPQNWKKASKTARHEEGSEKMSFQDKPVRALQPGISGNTEIIDSLIRIKRERVAHTSHIKAISRKSIQDIDLNLEDKILPNTAPIPIDKNIEEIAKLNELSERRQKKIKDFVLMGDEEDEQPSEDDFPEEDREISDFESYEDAPSILHDILQLKGSLAVRLVMLALTSLLSVYLNLANDLSWPLPSILSAATEPAIFLFINIILGLLSAFVSYTALSCGITKLLKLQADCDSLSALAMVSSVAAACLGFLNLSLIQEGKLHIYISVAIVCLLFNTIGKLLIVGRTARNFQFVSGDYERYAVFTVNNEERASLFTRGTMNDFPVLASMRKTEFISDFLKNSYAPDITDKFCRIAAPCIALGSLLMGIITGFFYRGASSGSYIALGASSFAGCAALCAGFAVILVINLPMKKATSKYLEHSSVMLSYQSVEEFSDTNSVLIDVSQLFPQGMINLSAIKIFSDTRIDEAIVEAASLTSHAGSILKHMFYDIIAGKTEMLNPVESYIYEDSMGLCGWINNKRILLGNRELMNNHSIGGLPTKEREKEYTENGKAAVYLSIAGELSAMFVIEIKANLEVRRWLRELERNEVYVILRTVDSVISINRLAELFDISPDMLKLLPFRLHPNFEEETSYVPRQSASLACAGRFPSFASLIVGTKRMRKNAVMGLCIQSAGLILGFLIGVILTLLSSFDQLNASMALAYNLGWSALTLILQGVRKS